MSTDGTGVWLYALMGGSPGDRLDGLTGVAGERVRSVAAADLSAAVGDVPLSEFGEEALRRHLEDLDWLAVAARAHDRVISTIAQSDPVLPVTMATVYRDDDSVKRIMIARRADFVAALRRVTGRDELGVKAYADPTALTSHTVAAQQVSGGAGAAYLMKRRRELAQRDEAHRIAAAEAERLHSALMRQAVDGRRKPASDPSLSGRQAWTVLNGTYLVERGEVDAFRAAVASLQQTVVGIELEITGPWPPYSFTGDVVEP